MVIVDTLLNTFGGFVKIALICGFVWVSAVFREKPYQTLYYFIKDVRAIDKERYTGYGFWLYAGLMGSGKTVSMTEKIMQLKNRFPKLHVVGNFTHSLIDESFETWEEMVKMKNPNGVKYGLLICFDEIHLTFESSNWKKAPTNLLETISMARKNHTQIIASSQVFGRVNKKLREQTNYVIECRTIFNRWTFNKAFTTEDYAVNSEQGDSGMRKRKRSWRYNFVQTPYIRSLFNTYELLTDLHEPKSNLIDIDDLECYLSQQDT